MDKRMQCYRDTVEICGDENMNAWQRQNTHAYFLHGWHAAKNQILDEINKHITSGQLPGNGMDKTAERNGMILATNIISQMDD